MPSTGETPFQRLARQVKARMQVRQFDNENALANAAGLKWDTVIAVTRGDLKRITAPTVAKLEGALAWPAGTIRGILDGADPPDDRIVVPLPHASEYSPEDFERLEAWIQRSIRAFDEHLRGGTANGVRRGEE